MKGLWETTKEDYESHRQKDIQLYRALWDNNTSDFENMRDSDFRLLFMETLDNATIHEIWTKCTDNSNCTFEEFTNMVKLVIIAHFNIPISIIQITKLGIYHPELTPQILGGRPVKYLKHTHIFLAHFCVFVCCVLCVCVFVRVFFSYVCWFDVELSLIVLGVSIFVFFVCIVFNLSFVFLL